MLHPQSKHQKRPLGFTLAELLIALAILAEIATFTIPKILTSQQNAKRAAVLKESLSSLQSVIYTGMITGQLTPTNNLPYIYTHINAVKICSTNSQTEGCWTQPHFDGYPQDPGFVLPNGATLNGFDTPWSPQYNGPGQWACYFYIDWNGPDGPNLEGQDQLTASYSIGTATWQNGSGWGIIRPGEMVGSENHPTSAAAYKALW